MPAKMTGKELYSLWLASLQINGSDADKFEELDESDREVWETFADRVERRVAQVRGEVEP